MDSTPQTGTLPDARTDAHTDSLITWSVPGIGTTIAFGFAPETREPGDLV